MRRTGSRRSPSSAPASRTGSSRHLHVLLVTFCLFSLGVFTLTLPCSAQQPIPPPAQLPTAPTPQSAINGSISGTITDTGDATIPNARITLTLTGQPTSPAAATTTDDGAFTLPNIPPGPFTLTVSAPGFAPRQLPGTLHPSESLTLPAIVLNAATSSDVQVTATQTEIAQAQVGEEEKQRILGFIPNFYVSYVSDPVPLTTRQKFQLADHTLFDPVSIILNGAAAGAEQATDTYAWGEGAQGYAKRYAAAYGDLLTNDMLGNFVFPTLFKQDPRYFYKGKGTIHSRIGYAIATAVICKGDNGHWQLDYSAILGGLASGAISNLYYPEPDRAGGALTFESAGIGTIISAASNIFQEFLIPHLTPHIPPRALPNP